MANLKVGNSVRIKSIDWYNQNKNQFGRIENSNKEYYFSKYMTRFCGKKLTIERIEEECGIPVYHLKDGGGYKFNEYMFEKTKTYTYIVAYKLPGEISSEIIHLDHPIDEEDINTLETMQSGYKVLGFSCLN